MNSLAYGMCVGVMFFESVELHTWKRTASEVSTVAILVWLNGNPA